MTAVISGDTGIDQIQDGAVSTAAKLAAAVVTAPKLSGAQTGSAPVYGIRAWANRVGATVGTIAPTAGGNISTIQRVSAGKYACVFTTQMPNADYIVVPSVRGNNVDQDGWSFMVPSDIANTTAGFTVCCYSSRAGGLTDPTHFYVHVIG